MPRENGHLAQHTGKDDGCACEFLCVGGGGGGNAYAELSFHVIPLSFKNDFDIKKIQLQNIFIFFENSCG